MSGITLQAASASHTGRVRGHNEDCVSVNARAGLAVLADGMGGHNAGEVASRMAADAVNAALSQRLSEPRLVEPSLAEALIASQVAAANAAVFDAARAERQYEGMGTTLVVALWHEAGVTYAHVGDSRLYLLRRGELRQLTRDHSIVQEQLERGAISLEQARYSANRNVLTRAVGIDPKVSADVRTHDVMRGDVYLLCSDGLTDMMSDGEIRQTLLDCGHDLERAARRLVERANEAGGIDNISVILVRVEKQAG